MLIFERALLTTIKSCQAVAVQVGGMEQGDRVVNGKNFRAGETEGGPLGLFRQGRAGQREPAQRTQHKSTFI